MSNTKIKKILSILLCALTLASIVPITAYADEEIENEEIIEQVTEEVTEEVDEQVEEIENVEIPITSISRTTKNSYIFIEVGKTKKASIIILPEDATNKMVNQATTPDGSQTVVELI